MSMEAHKLRFVRCPKCLQLLVEYPSIPVYQCGGCGTVLRAKIRGTPVAHTKSESGEHNNFARSLEGSPQNSKTSLEGYPQNSKTICSDEQKAVLSNVQPSENVVEGNISSVSKDANSCEIVNPERTMPTGESATPDEIDNDEKCSISDGNARSPESVMKETDAKGTGANSSPEMVENVETTENANEENGCSTDDANNGSVGRKVAAVHCLAGEESGDDSSNNMRGEIESVPEQKCSTSNKNMSCQEIAERNKLHEEDGAKSNDMLEERSQPYEGLRIESYEDLIEELERSLSLSDDEEDYLDVTDSNGLNDALHQQISSRRFSSGGKMNDASRSDPHGRLIEELERSFSDAEEPLEHHAEVAEKEISEKVHVNDHGKDPLFLVNGSANPYEESMHSSDDGHIKSGQSFEQNELAADGTNEKEEGHMEDDNRTDCVHENEHVMVRNKDIAEKIHGNEHDEDLQYLVTESANLCEGSMSSSNNGHLKSGQSFEQNELAADGTNEKEEGHMEDDNRTDCVHENEHVMVRNKDIAEKIHGNEHDEDLQYLVTESANLCEGSMSSSNNGHLKSGQSFQQNNLTADDTEQKEESCMENHNNIDCVRANEHVVVINKDIAERIPGNEHDMDPQYLGAEHANVCDEDTSSFIDGHLKSEQSFRQHELTADGTEEKKEGYTEDGNMTICVQADNAAAVADFSSLSNERIHCKSPSFCKKKEEISCRYRASLLRQGLSLDSEDFKSIQNFIESQMDGTSSSLSSGSPSQGDLALKTSNKFKTVDQLERLKKMDDLRDQLNRLSSQNGLERRYQKKDLEYQLQLNSYDAEQHLRSADADSIPSSCTLDSYYGHGKPPRYPQPNPFSPPHSCAHCHFGHVQPHIPHNYDAWEFNSYYQSSHAGSSVLDHDSFKSSFKEQKRMVRKHILRPLSGASPYTVCNSCFNLVQMPSDIYTSKRKIGKMQCGQCSKVIVLSCPAVNHANASTSKEVARKASKPAGRTDSKTEAASYPDSISESYGASFTRSFSTRAGPALTATESSKKVSESALHRLMGYDSASQLLRHSRVFERHSRVFDDGYESFESMVPVSNRVSRRKNM